MSIYDEIDGALQDITVGASAAFPTVLVWNGIKIPVTMGMIKRDHEHVEGGEWPIYTAQAMARRADIGPVLPQNGDLVEVQGFAPFSAQSGRRVNKTLRIGAVTQHPGKPMIIIEIVNAPTPRR